VHTQRKGAASGQHSDETNTAGALVLPSNIPSNASAPNQTLDMSTVVQQLAEVRQQQSNILQELAELKHRNDTLWKMSMNAQGEMRKNQETVARIVEFLAGIFGQRASGAVSNEGSPVVPRLMIEDRPGRKEKAQPDDHAPEHTTPPTSTSLFVSTASIECYD
jgi:hypothetical protein